MARIIENPKQLILDNAKNILYSEGYSNLSIRNVAKASGLAVGTIYNYYPTKKDLVIEMMIEYWGECFKSLEIITNSQTTLYVKLFKIFSELNIFISTFKEVWLKANKADNTDNSNSGLEKENLHMENHIEKLIRTVEKLLIEESARSNSEITIKMDTYELAKFIVMNFITMIQMQMFKYESFENILKQLLE